jgi:copper chaperone CopZ
MKTSVTDVSDMLSVPSVDGVEACIGEVGGVESVTVNFAAGSATVRYDETRLKAGDIEVAVRQAPYVDADTAPAAARHTDLMTAPSRRGPSRRRYPLRPRLSCPRSTTAFMISS